MYFKEEIESCKLTMVIFWISLLVRIGVIVLQGIYSKIYTLVLELFRPLLPILATVRTKFVFVTGYSGSVLGTIQESFDGRDGAGTSTALSGLRWKILRINKKAYNEGGF